ncbi:hypothetical protein K3495_g14075 [Podosphaera aphanis]|nr:hypothetical protein K3495_g14075 [Podosphaera aphanis]
MAQKLKANIAECTVAVDDILRGRENRIWIPDFEPFRTAIMQKIHDSNLAGHSGNIHKRFHVEIVKRAGTDPYPSRLRDDAQNPPVLDEFVEPDLDVESILRARTVKRGRVTFRQAMVKWVGWKTLDDFEEKYGPNETNNGPAESETGMFVGLVESSTVQKRRERRKAKGDHGNLRKKIGPCDG